MTTEALAKSRYEYGRHETFAVRHGWLGKGLHRMEASPDGFTADKGSVVELGLGTGMVKSLRYWLEATGLGHHRPAPDGAKGVRGLHTSELGQVVLARDPYLEYPATWWFLHLKLARRSGSVWGWFFNEFRERTFDRATANEGFMSHLHTNAANATTSAVAQRDVACVLTAYCKPPVGEPADPEDGTVSPLRDLGLLLKHDATGRYEKTRPLDEIAIEIFLACVAAELDHRQQNSMSVGEMLGQRRSPGIVLGLTAEAIEDLAARAARDYAKLGVGLDRLGAERRLRVPGMGGMHFWLDRHFQRVGRAE